MVPDSGINRGLCLWDYLVLYPRTIGSLLTLGPSNPWLPPATSGRASHGLLAPLGASYPRPEWLSAPAIVAVQSPVSVPRPPKVSHGLQHLLESPKASRSHKNELERQIYFYQWKVFTCFNTKFLSNVAKKTFLYFLVDSTIIIYSDGTLLKICLSPLPHQEWGFSTSQPDVNFSLIFSDGVSKTLKLLLEDGTWQF